MSFSSEVREELSQQGSSARHCQIALIAALFHLCPVLTQEYAGIRTENTCAAQAFESALRKVWSDPVESVTAGREIIVLIRGREQVRRFLEMVKLDHVIGMDEAGRDDVREKVQGARISQNLLQKTCCRKAFLRGMFLVAGSVSDPSKSYHLEIAPLSEEDARALIVSGFAENVSKELPLEYAVEMNNLIRDEAGKCEDPEGHRGQYQPSGQFRGGKPEEDRDCLLKTARGYRAHRAHGRDPLSSVIPAAGSETADRESGWKPAGAGSVR